MYTLEYPLSVHCNHKAQSAHVGFLARPIREPADRALWASVETDAFGAEEARAEPVR